jgi:hypothetical protein
MSVNKASTDSQTTRKQEVYTETEHNKQTKQNHTEEVRK